jgi:acyl-CoA synthetase (AMP-forming)/AMP-acid ligase II
MPTRCVHELVADWAGRQPEAVALSAGGATMTYRQLDARADGLAAMLIDAGVGTDEAVAVLADRSPELIVALLAVLKAGAAYLALDTGWPLARIAELVTNAGVRTAIVQPALADRVAESVEAVLPLRATMEQAAAARRTVPTSAVPGDLAYVSYTSGSTGQAKAVCVPHAAVHRLVSEPNWASFGPADVFLQASPVAFDARSNMSRSTKMSFAAPWSNPIRCSAPSTLSTWQRPACWAPNWPPCSPTTTALARQPKQRTSRFTSRAAHERFDHSDAVRAENSVHAGAKAATPVFITCNGSE